MKEKEAILVLKALGAKETTSKTQKKNGTSQWELRTGEVVTEHSNGYVRKKMFDSYGRVEGCYQINHVKKVKQSWTYDNGNYYEYYHYVRTMLHNRAERLERLIKFAARKIEAQKEGVINYINS